MIGFIMVFLDPYNRIARTAATIGDKAFWGKEVVLECRAAVLGFLFDEMGVHKVWGRVNTRNIPSVFNYKAQGFVCEGVMREHGRKPDGSRVDQYLFGLLRKDWVAAKAAVAKNG
jgi:RimJ/RimL family protein N-acetyltransferase